MTFWRHFRLFTIALIGCAFFGMNLSGEVLSAKGISFGNEEELSAKKIPFGGGDVNLPTFTPRNNTGEGQIAGVVYSVFGIMKVIVGSVALVAMVWSGLLLVSSGGNDENVEEGKRAFTWAALGMIFLLLIEPAIRDVFYRGGDVLATAEDTRKAAEAGSQIIIDTLSWLEGLLIIVAVGALLTSGFSLISALGESDQISKQKTVFLWVGIGVVVMLINRVVVQEIIYPYYLGDDFFVEYKPSPTTGISEMVSIIKYFLQFLALLIFLAFVYGGGMMILAFGEEDRVETGKKTMRGAALGALVILLSYALVSTFITFQS